MSEPASGAGAAGGGVAGSSTGATGMSGAAGVASSGQGGMPIEIGGGWHIPGHTAVVLTAAESSVDLPAQADDNEARLNRR